MTYKVKDYFPMDTSPGIYTNWFKVDNMPAVQYQHESGVWARVVEHKYDDIVEYEIEWSGQPGMLRYLGRKDEACALAKWLVRQEEGKQHENA